MKKMKNNTLKKTTTKSATFFVNNFSRSSRVQKWHTPSNETVTVEKSNIKFSNQKSVCSSQKKSKFLRQRHSSFSIDLNYIFPTVKSMLGNLKEEELQSLDYKVLYKAEELIKKLRSISKKNKLWWHQPLLNISIDHEIVFEWWYKRRSLIIYVCPNTIDFIKVWGADMDNEMEDGSIYLKDNSLSFLWQWLVI